MMMKEKDAYQMMYELEENGIDRKEEFKEAAKVMPEMVKETVVDGYKKIEDAVVGGYKKIEEGAVAGFNKVTDKAVEKLFAKEGETVEEAKERLSGKIK